MFFSLQSLNGHLCHIAMNFPVSCFFFRILSQFINKGLVLVYNAFILPHFDYCCEVWGTNGKGRSERLQKLQNRAARHILNFKNEHGQCGILKDLNSSKCLKILKKLTTNLKNLYLPSQKTKKTYIDPLKITFKPSNFVRNIFLMCSSIRPPPPSPG